MTHHPTPPADQPPREETPAGPVWVVEHPGETRPYRVRRLPDDPGLLKLGATLRHLGASSRPRLQAPTVWWKDREHTWVAAPCCPGVPLATADLERKTWSDAVDTITPLALALRGAHRNGTVHGSLAPWNVYYDETTDRLTAVDFGLWPHEHLEAGPFWPAEMHPDGDEAHPGPATDIHNLARLVIHLALSPRAARRARPNFETLPAYAISTLHRALDPESDNRPQTIDEFLAGLRFRQRPTVTTTTADADSAVVGRVREIETFEHDRRGSGVRFRLDTADQHDSPGVFVYRQQAPMVFDSLSLLWEGAELTLIEPETVENSAGELFLTAGDATLPVIEPHWPVSVSDALKARGCPRRVLVDMRDPGERTHHLAFGTLVHQFLEDLTADAGLSFEEALCRRLPPLRLDFLAAGVDDAQMSELIDDARRQFEHLRRFTARRTADSAGRDRVGWCGEHAEATRYSSLYGLEGRTDLVVTDPDEGLQIIELKTGKPWHDHAGQVQSYALLWQRLADRRQLATTGRLLYSRQGRMKEVPVEGTADRQALVHGRNSLMAMFRSFVDPGYDYRPPHYMEQPALCRDGACRFRKDRCRDQTATLGSNERMEGHGENATARRAYLNHWTRLIETERWSDHSRLGAIFDHRQLPTRIADGTAADDLQLRPLDDDNQRAELVGDRLHIFSPGDRILLHRGDVDTHHVLRAKVVSPPTAGCVELELRAATIADEFVGPGWIADTLPSRIGYRTAHRALYRLLDHAPDDVVDLLVHPHRSPETTVEPPGDETLHRATRHYLNDSQLAALKQGLSTQSGSLIQGPPGTGKTTVIAHLTCELATRGDQVLLSALTNTAVDTMLVQLLDAAYVRDEVPPTFLRLGSADRSPLLADELRRRGYDPSDYFSDDLAADTDSLETLAERLDGIDVVATTAHSSIRHSATTWFEDRRGTPAFDVALVDEASQLTEPMALAPICAAQRFVLIGDHRQLPPIVSAERAMTAFVETPDRQTDTKETPPNPLRDAAIGGLDRSLFERLARFVAPRMLTTQYRMHRDLMGFPADNFYDGRLTAHPSVADRTLPIDAGDIAPVVDPDTPVVFVDIDGTEEGRTNPDEARALIETVRRLGEWTPEATVGVLSPFRAQVHLLRRLYDDGNDTADVDVDTVERFQGNERDVICASLVKTDHPGDFVSDVRRINVAFTRARMKLIVFGCGSCLRQDPLFREWLDAETTVIVQGKQL